MIIFLKQEDLPSLIQGNLTDAQKKVSACLCFLREWKRLLLH